MCGEVEAGRKADGVRGAILLCILLLIPGIAGAALRANTRFAPTNLVFGIAGAAVDDPSSVLINRMKQAFERVSDYRALLRVTTFGAGGSLEVRRMRYAFKKPRNIRIDMISPEAGMTIVSPGKDGKVAVRRPGWLGFFTFHLAPDSPRLKVAPGQSIVQTDLGLLIDNMARSMTEWRRGEIRLTTPAGSTAVDVVSRNHFLPDVTTRYTFRVDTSLWLPVGVEERNTEGTLIRTVVFSNLTVNGGIDNRFFDPDAVSGEDREKKAH